MCGYIQNKLYVLNFILKIFDSLNINNNNVFCGL